VEYRQQNGGFKKIEELMNVRGIGEASFLKLKALVTITPLRNERAAAQ
jgi:competence protein ComEA